MVILIGDAAPVICKKSLNQRIPDQAVEKLFSKPLLPLFVLSRIIVGTDGHWLSFIQTALNMLARLKLMEADQWKFVLSPDSSGDSVFYSMFV